MAVEQFKQLAEAGVRPEDDTPEGGTMRRILGTSHETKLLGEEAGVIEDADQDEIPSPDPGEASKFKTGPEQDPVPSRVLTEEEKTGPEALPEPSLRLPVEERTGPEAEPRPARDREQPPVEQDLDDTTIAGARLASTSLPPDESALEKHIAEHGGTTKPQKRGGKDMTPTNETTAAGPVEDDDDREDREDAVPTEDDPATEDPSKPRRSDVEEAGGGSARSKSGRRG